MDPGGAAPILVFAFEHSMVNRTNWESSAVEITPVSLSNSATGETHSPKNLFCIRLPTQAGQILVPADMAYIPEQLQSYFVQHDVARFSVEVLPVGRLASRLLPGEPNALVCGIVSKSGEVVSAIPKPLFVARWMLRGCAWALSLGAASALLVDRLPVISALSLAVGVLAFRAAADIPAA